MLPEDLVADWLGLTDEADVALAEAAADRALTWIETQTGRHFREVREFEMRFSGGRKTYWLPEIPRQMEEESDSLDVLTVEEKDSAGAWVEIDDADYELIRPDMDRLYEMPTLEHESEWPCGRKNIRVTFEAGYAVGGLPGDIEQLVLDMVSAWWFERGREGLKKEEVDGYSYEKFMAGDGQRFTDDWKASLTKWKHPVLGAA